MEHSRHHQSWAINHERYPNDSTSHGNGHALRPGARPEGLPYYFQPPPSAQRHAPLAPFTVQILDYGTAPQAQAKQVRVTQACSQCRSRKQKCSDIRPCQYCKESNLDCEDTDVLLPKQDRMMMQLQKSVKGVSDRLSQLVDQFDGWKSCVDSRLPPSQNHEIMSKHASPEASFPAPLRENDTSGWPAHIQRREHVGRVNSALEMESPIVPHSSMMLPLGAQASVSVKQELQTERSHVTEKSLAERMGLQGDHTTPAHMLLDEWQQMSIFCVSIPYLRDLVDKGLEVSDYPMQLEQDRGLLRIWGVGEGRDSDDGAQGPGSPESSTDSEAPSPAPVREGLWGYPSSEVLAGTKVLSSTPREYFPPKPRQENGLGADGRPDLRRHVMFDLLRSYMEIMHIFHPFMEENRLRRMFNDFSDQYSPDATPLNAHSPAPVHGVKRKRSESNLEGLPSRRGEIERSLCNAIILLVLALGKVCSYKDPLPAPQDDPHPHVRSERGYIRDSPHPKGSFSNFNSNISDENCPKNIDLLPGLAYYAYATDILGNQQGGNTVAHAQAMLLAALFFSQYARVLESWSWISNACRVVLVLIKADYTKLLRVNSERRPTWSSEERYRINSILYVYWTALQLESDLLAEMSTLPPSGISRYQSEIMYPEGVNENRSQDEVSNSVRQNDGVNASSREGLIMKLYYSQSFLRVVLNAAHDALYSPGRRIDFGPTSFNEIANHARTHMETLESWRKLLTPELVWSDDEYPSTDLNIARVRAKYYGGLYMMLRPYLRIASHTLSFSPPPSSTTGVAQHSLPSPYGSAAPNRNVQMVDPNEGQRKIIIIACRCINAAIQSTIAFDRVGEEPGSQYHYFQPTRRKRLIVTNIFGTLHAQFGNMLVLVSVYKSKLYLLLPSDTWLTRDNLIALLKRTIAVISEEAQNSPILRMDLEILRNVQKQQGLE
ncbi:c6 zinc finger-like protein [Alternaria alternata]|nr:c6 zinc finger-like protein [Alternaria alternata]